MTIKTEASRFQVHDELTAPDPSAQLLRRVLAVGGSITNFIGVLAGAPAVLRAYTRFRSELRAGVLAEPTRLRIALAVAGQRRDDYGLGQHARAARVAGLGIDEIARACDFNSADPREAGLLTYLRAAIVGRPPLHLHEEARELGWSDEQILEALAQVALTEFESLVAGASELPEERGSARPSALPSAA